MSAEVEIDMRRFIQLSVPLIIAGLAVGCSNGQAGPPKEIRYRLRHSPPTKTDIIEALMASARIELTDSSCRGAGTDPSDKTVGEYISGLVVDLSDPEAKNYLEIEKPTSARDSWSIQLMIRSIKGGDILARGMEFTIHKSDGQVDSRSFRCRGGG